MARTGKKQKKGRKKGSSRDPLPNAEVARLIRRKADLLEIQGANSFRVRAYRNAARTVESHSVQLHRMVSEGEELTGLQGIGKDLARQIERAIRTGRLPNLSRLEKQTPGGLAEVLKVPGLGPRKTETLWKELEIEGIDDLEKAAEGGKIADLEGFGPKTQEKILRGIRAVRRDRGRFKLAEAEQHVTPLLEYLGKLDGVERMEVAGSYRRRKETVGDIDILVTAGDAEEVMDHFTSYGAVDSVEQAGTTRATVRLQSGLQVDLRVLDDESYGAALVYFTGSKEHNLRLRRRALDRDLQISEYGVFKKGEKGKKGSGSRKSSGGKSGSKSRVAGRSEEDVYKSVDLRWVPPEIREDRGEIEAASSSRKKLPDLVELDDIRGDLQMHSKWSDGKTTISKMLEGCVERGYDYFAITDHSKALAMTGGLDEKQLRKQIREIERLQEKHDEIRILKSLEIDILEDGSLDLSDDMIEELDYVLVSVHSHMGLSGSRQTRRIVKALEHPSVNALAHPTGRRIQARDPMEFDLGEVLDCARENGVALELNAQPDRLDLPDDQLLEAKKRGVKIVLGTDAHRPEELEFMRYGVDQARRAWLTADDILNTRTLRQLEKLLG